MSTTIKSGMSRGIAWSIAAGVLLLFAAFGGGSWWMGLAGIGVLIFVGRILYTRSLADKKLLQPWPWPAELRVFAEGMARPIDPTPKRLLPPHENASLVAHVATTKEGLSGLIADKPAAWPWAVFTSVLVQRRNAVQTRLRSVASGYQPRIGAVPSSGQVYSQIAQRSMTKIIDLVNQMEQFMLSPAFKGAFGRKEGAEDADADAVANVANRLMDYHEAFLVHAETCLQTSVEAEALTFVQDAGAIAMLPLLGYEEFVVTMCARIAEAQELLPYGDGDTVMQLDDVSLAMTVPDDLSERFVAHMKRFNPPT